MWRLELRSGRCVEDAQSLRVNSPYMESARESDRTSRRDTHTPSQGDIKPGVFANAAAVCEGTWSKNDRLGSSNCRFRCQVYSDRGRRISGDKPKNEISDPCNARFWRS